MAVFLDFLRPLLDHASKRLSERLEALATKHQPVPFDLGRLAVLWVRPLPRQLLLMATRTLMLELYIRRLEESLVGDTPEERFASFLASLREADGAAGSIASLLALQEHHPSSDTLAIAVACGDHLLAKAEAQEEGIAWRLPKVAELPLTGFAHGVAGIAWALARLTTATGEARFAEAARAAIAYERHLFSCEHDNWPDLRFDRRTDEGWAYFYAWCHGAPGIGLGRLALLDLWSDPQIEEEVRAAVRSTLRHGYGGSLCLCHGDLGNLELLVKAGEQLADPQLASQANELAGRILASIDSSGARCGVSSRVELPGLMVGLAGIGYGLLRLADPRNVPSVMLLETPKPMATELPTNNSQPAASDLDDGSDVQPHR